MKLKNLFIFGLVFMFLFSFVSGNIPNADYSKMIFYDEFSGSLLNTSLWNQTTGTISVSGGEVSIVAVSSGDPNIRNLNIFKNQGSVWGITFRPTAIETSRDAFFYIGQSTTALIDIRFGADGNIDYYDGSLKNLCGSCFSIGDRIDLIYDDSVPNLKVYADEILVGTITSFWNYNYDDRFYMGGTRAGFTGATFKFDYIYAYNGSTFPTHVSNFTITAQDARTGTALTNFSATVDSVFYNTTTGSIVTLINESRVIDVEVGSNQFPGYATRTYTNYNTSTDLAAELFKKNSLEFQTYWENGTIIDNQTFTAEFVSDVPSEFILTTNASGYLFTNNLTPANWEITVFNDNFRRRKFYFTLDEGSFNSFNVYFPLPDNQGNKTFKIKNSLDVFLENTLITLTRLIDDAFVALSQEKTDSTGTARFLMNDEVNYRLIIEADGYETREFSITTQPSIDEYTITLLTPTTLNFTTIFDRFSYSISPTNSTLENKTYDFNFTTSSPGGYLSYFFITDGTTTTNVSSSPSGGTAILNLDLSSFSNEGVTLTYGAKIDGFDLFTFEREYYVYNNLNKSTSIGSAKQDFEDLLGDNIVLGAFFVAVLVLLISFLFPVDQVKGTKSLNSISIMFFIALFGWLGVFPITMSIMVVILTLLSLVGGGV